MLRIPSRYLDLLIPDKLLEETNDLFKIRFFILMMVIALAIMLVSSIFNFTGIVYTHDYFGIEFSYIIIPIILLWLTKNFKITVHSQMILASSSLIFTIFQTGGIFSHLSIWLYILPIMVLFFIGFRPAIHWSIYLALVFIVIYQLSHNNNIVNINALEISSTDHLYNNLIFLFFIGVSIYLFWSGQHRLFIRLKEKQKDSKIKNEQLERKTEELRFAQEALISSNQALDRYARAVSHDLKEPLRSITSFTSLLYRHYDKQDLIDDRSQEFFDFVIDGGENMGVMIKEMLLLSKVSEQDFKNLKLVNLNNIVEIALKNLDTQIKEARVEITYDTLPYIKGLQGSLIQLFQNIISNAIKFRKPDITPTISIHAEENDSNWTIMISDNGIGIKRENYQKIFGEFDKIHNNEAFKGHGIGLATCKKIIEQHNEKIGVQSIYGEGSIFYFTLPKISFKEEMFTDVPEVLARL